MVGVLLDDLREEEEEEEEEDEEEELFFFFSLEGFECDDDDDEDDEVDEYEGEDDEELWRRPRGRSETEGVVVEGLEEEYEINDECEAELPNRLERWSMACIASIRDALERDLRYS